MAMNPMQRKSRNSFLLGMLLTLLLSSIIITVLFLQLTKLKDEADKLEKSYVTAYVLNKGLESGATISMEDVKLTKISKNILPADFISAADLTDEDGKEKIAKIDLQAGTVLTQSMLNDSSDMTSDDTRVQEYNMIVLPSQLDEGDYIDIRWMLPNGQDYIVISKKKVISCDETSVWLNMNEDEILTMSGAIVESYMTTGSKLYAIKYAEPGNQKTSTETYMPSNEVINLITADSNIVNETRTKLAAKYTDNVRQRRSNEIQGVLNQYKDTALESIESKVQEEIAKQQEARQLYLDQLGAGI